jgi:pimeloyl-ACP methyl ester carboxylesterase
VVEAVDFYSSGIPIAADLYLPSADPPSRGSPVIVACLGWGSVKELMRPWGEALSSRGFSVLVPDYRGFGSSGGERGRCFPYEHVDDIRAAVTYASDRSELDSDRVTLLGVSYGGGVAVAAAGLDSRVAALVSVVAYGSGERHLRSIRTEEQWTEFRTRLEADRSRRVSTGESEEIDPDEILLRDEEARAWRRAMEAEHPAMAFRTTLESAQKMIEFWPERHLPSDRPVPALFVHAGEDTMVPVDESKRMWQRAAEPKRLVVIPDIGHHEVHRGEAFARVIAEIDGWLGEHLGSGSD